MSNQFLKYMELHITHKSRVACKVSARCPKCCRPIPRAGHNSRGSRVNYVWLHSLPLASQYLLCITTPNMLSRPSKHNSPNAERTFNIWKAILNYIMSSIRVISCRQSDGRVVVWYINRMGWGDVPIGKVINHHLYMPKIYTWGARCHNKVSINALHNWITRSIIAIKGCEWQEKLPF